MLEIDVGWWFQILVAELGVQIANYSKDLLIE